MSAKRNVEDSMPNLDALEGMLRYRFAKRELLMRALTRRAYAKERIDKGERCEDQNALCVLGDAVLDAIITQKLTDDGMDKKGDITEERKKYVSRVALHRLSKDLKLHGFIRTNKSESVNPNRPRLLAETLEAIIGAMLLDSGYEQTRRAVLKWYGP